jgi:hypothetical protein
MSARSVADTAEKTPMPPALDDIPLLMALGTPWLSVVPEAFQIN